MAGWILTAFSVIVFVVDFVERGWRMIERYEIGFKVVAYYYLNYMPFYIILAFPVAMLVSTLFSMGSLAKNRELDVMKASGLSLYRISFPILAAAFVLSIIVALDVAKAYNKDSLFGIILLWLLPPVGYILLGFGDAKYSGSAKSFYA